MPLAKLIESAAPEERDFLLDLFGETKEQRAERVNRRLLETKRRLTRAKSNQIFNFWLKSGFIEGDQFGSVWLNDKGRTALCEYEELHSHHD